MRFWDTSAIVPLIVEQPASKAQRELFTKDPLVIVAWTTMCECFSALARLEREGVLDGPEFKKAERNLREFSKSWIRVSVTVNLEEEAMRLLRIHALRTADALQLASALLVSERAPRTLGFVTLDDRLRLAADKEGFVIE